ncbi:hypothetical protein Lepto7376_2745 [[Leptolyngbya] sp. PCC 7376]|uniref:cupin-like domain-containing protein n=1 Tax=[Leptolyngbya] sp. PCC 7376 TaxID=111781 RepID=UPI00029F40FE|nr:cupin-like domain-containing protein [[Leptolyngbya] sp. PCC 7376]AFY39006.1 hypothetical protein Lepto7376_2745 [[Leptolyngbya] sp. PCC 7376]
MTIDVTELQNFALDFLQQRLTNPDVSEQEKVDIALGILKLQSLQPNEVNSSIARNHASGEELSGTLPIPELYTLSESWQTWLIENKLRGVSDQSLVEILTGQGITQETANHVVFALPQEVSFAYIQPQWRSLQQQKLIAELYREKEQTADLDIDYRNQLAIDDFKRHYYQANRPVVLTDLGGDRPWQTAESLAQTFGAHPITPLKFPELSSSANLTTLSERPLPDTVGDYLAIAEPQVYINFDLIELGTEAIANAYATYPRLKTYLNSEIPAENQIFLWLQSTFSAFPLQAKVEDLLIVQLWGESHWHLAAPWQSEFLYGDENWISSIDLEDYNEQRYPLCPEAKFYSLTLTQGQALFIPALWWQQCRAIETSGQLCFRNIRTKFP